MAMTWLPVYQLSLYILHKVIKLTEDFLNVLKTTPTKAGNLFWVAVVLFVVCSLHFLLCEVWNDFNNLYTADSQLIMGMDQKSRENKT